MFLGIDLGTSNSVICGIVDANGKNLARLFKTADGADTLPSVIYVDKRGSRLYGRRAQDQVLVNPDAVAHGFKRLMGTATPIELKDAKIALTPEECSADIIRQLLAQAATETGGAAIEQVIITIPAAFNQMQSEATLRAAERAGITAPVKLLQEPVAAAIAAAHLDTGGANGKAKQFLIYDLGGGTFDLALARTDENEIKIVANQGINMLGGRDFDRRMVQDIIRPWLAENFELPEDFMRLPAYRRLLRVAQLAAEKAKIELSSRESVTVFASDSEVRTEDTAGADIFLDVKITRDQFEDLISDTVNRTVAVTQQLLTEQGLNAGDIDRLVFIGGPSKIPLIRQRVAADLGLTADLSLDPMTTVALGAAYYAAQLRGKTVVEDTPPPADETRTVTIDEKPVEKKAKKAAKAQPKVTILAAKTIAVKVRSPDDEQNILLPVLKAGTPLPASGKQSFAAGQPLDADHPQELSFELFQLEFPERLELNLCVGAFRIGLEDLPEGYAIKEGDQLDFDWHMNDSGILTATVSITSGDGEPVKLSSPRFYAPQEGERSFAGSEAYEFARAVLRQGSEELDDVLAALGPMSSRDIDLLRHRLEEQDQTLTESQADPELIRQVGEEARFIRQDMARLTRRYASAVLQRRMGRLMASYNRTARAHATDSERGDVDRIIKELNALISAAGNRRFAAISEGKPATDGGVSAADWTRAERLLADMRRYFFAGAWRNPAYVQLWYEQVSREAYLFPDPEEYAELMAEADAAKAANDNDKLQQVMNKLLSARVSLGASGSAADLATIKQA